MAVAPCRAAAAGRATLPRASCPISAQCRLISTSSRWGRRRDQTGLYPKPQTLSSLRRLWPCRDSPAEAPRCAMRRGGGARIALPGAMQPVGSHAAHPAPAAPRWQCRCLGPRQRWVWPAASPPALPGSGAPGQRHPNICRDRLGTTAAFVLESEETKHPDFKIKTPNSTGREGLLPVPALSGARLKGGGWFLQRHTREREAEQLPTP